AEREDWTAQLLRAAHEWFPRNSDLAHLVEHLKPASVSTAFDPRESTLLRGNRVFVNRMELRVALRDLASPTGSRVLVVQGPPGSGKSYSVHLIRHVAEQTGGFRVHTFDVDNPPYPKPEDLAYSMISQFGGDTASMPVQGPATTSRWVRWLGDWMVRELVKS